ncbi:MAG: ParB/RepB/Spo0J family partition protein [Phycisphaerae bacterium]|nr:ParB/RepB/Spo0J family partition protein [Phycisphaerae bacterium]NIP54338.1 ParB/RepB/Spo0J family partition protein [Phycisphaerae bacterium]NIS53205.1 ParB/RepB/Spo0J family partition protein [Phycisphaerae bacterium]NIU10691.1 ParB/RepB/Spo0J family partition protein [Phycisphaerae bacterium]NIU58459.1 ParB/RepB/Spo0J family partition protein [Phycisphaerae bacterium]
MAIRKKEKQKHLGRGLESLLGPITSVRQVYSNRKTPDEATDANIPPDKELRESLKEISIDSISPNPYQARTVWDQQELEELAESIKANGVIQPIIVRAAAGGYELIAGERRFRASKLASLKTIPALVRQATDQQLLELALIENIHRTDLNPIERAKCYQSYLTTFSLTQADAAQRLGEDRSVIANYMRLLDLPSEIKQMLAKRQITMGHARAIIALPTDEIRRKLANRAMAGRLSVREVERLVRKYITGTAEPRKTEIPKPAHITDLEGKLCTQLGTKVTIETRKNGNRGKIIIEFHSLDEFDRIAEKIGLETVEKV